MAEQDTEQSAPQSVCGFVALIGSPNAGKSTLLNRMVGTKVSIVTHKVQTTRTRVLGIGLHNTAQVIFVDTPGIFTPKHRLDRAMVNAAWQGATDADEIALLVDASRGMADDVLKIIDGLRDSKRQAYLVLNKIDLVKRDDLLALTQKLFDTGVFKQVFMVSALKGDGCDDFLDALANVLPKSPWHFPEEQVSDMPMKLLAAEITREKLFLNVHEELPYQLTVENETWENFDNGDVKIEQTIYVERESQRAIILGHKGSRIRSIGAAARKELEQTLERKVHLFLFVKVREGWKDDPDRYRDWGLDFNS